MSIESPYYRRRNSKLRPALKLMLVLTLLAAATMLWVIHTRPIVTTKSVPAPAISASVGKPGDLIETDSVTSLSPAETLALIKHNYPSGVSANNTGITKVIFHYRSQLPDGELATVYGRAYLPTNNQNNLPIFAFAPGTTGIGDQCAASLENPAKSDWADYDSHLSAYATQGYAAVTTDYEGMRDPSRIHHYMVGELEGRALLDAVRALRHLPQSVGRLSPSDVFLAGYSQGGHAAFWGDKIAANYAADVRPLGVVGFGPVMSVKETLADIVHGANINWFGPNVVFSYENYYQKSYPGIILPSREATLAVDVQAHCIDTDLSFWGHNPATIYTPQFLQAVGAGTITKLYPEFAAALDANAVGAVTTPSAKRINEGSIDNVVLPAQQVPAAQTLCATSSGPVELSTYLGASHYSTMLRSFADTVSWMHELSAHRPVPTTCAVR
jgi:hypothetical protein